MEKKQDQSKEIWLRPNELERMIEGSLHWTEVAARLDCKPEKVPETNKSNLTPLKKVEGLKVVLLLVGAALSTIVTWVYFVFYH